MVFAVAVGIAETVKLTELVVDGTEPFASLTAKTTLAVLYVTVGVPVTAPDDEFKLRPVGRLPELT